MSAAPTVPGPEPRPLIGTLYAMDSEKPIQTNMKLAERYGEIFRQQIPHQAGLYFVSTQRLVNELCDEERFDKRINLPLQNIRDFAGNGLFTAHTEEPEWGQAHRVLMPAFAPMALRTMYAPMTDIAEQLMLKWERLGPDAEIDVVHDFTRLTLDTIALCAFSYRFNSFYSESMHPFVDAMVSALDEAGSRTQRLPVQNLLMRGQQRRYAEDIRVLNEVADRLIEQRKANPLPDGESDILDTMLGARDPQTGETLSDENVRYQMVTFLIAGHETTSGLLSFTLYELLRNPDVLATARRHVDEVLGDSYPRYEDLPRLGYLDQVLRESLRLWPTAPGFTLHPYESTTLGGSEPGAADGYPIQPEDAVVVLIPSLHRDPAVWTDPERFDPDRFTFDRAAEIPANAWKPFGNGQRSCIGRGFALQEAQLVLALLLQRFEVDWGDPDYRLDVAETLTMKPAGLTARLRLRTDRVPPRPGSAPADVAADAETAPAPGLAPAATHGTPAQILYGSNSGTSEAFAGQLATRARRLGYTPTVAPLDSAVDALSADGPVLIVTASYEGQPPDNAKAFVDWLQRQPAGALDGVGFAVFGNGNTDWARTYQRIPTLVDSELERAGGHRLAERGAANARGDFFGDFDGWHEGLWPAVGEAYGIDAPEATAVESPVQVEIVGPGREQLLRASDLDYGTIVVNRELVDMSRPGARSKRHLEFALPADSDYRAGDYLAVLPTNPAAVVDRALQRFDLAYDTRLQITAEATQLPVDGPVLAGELFSHWVELSLPAGRRQIEDLAAATPCPPERDELNRLAGEDYQAEVLDRRRSVLDLLQDYPSVGLSLASFLAMLTPLAPRQYSISSSPRWSADHVTLTVAELRAPALSGNGTYEGVASTYLAGARPGTRIPVSVRPSNVAFHPPEDLDQPLVMVCAGTGFAPFRGFLQDRALRAQERGTPPAPALLFFGCDDPEVDLLYAEELRAWQQQGVVDLRPAFSAAPEQNADGPMPFVQDRLWSDRSDVQALVRDGATFFVCGDGQRMAPAVHATCVRIYAAATGSSTEQAEAWLDAMQREHSRYVSDVFA